jgi:hypothetical protein
MVDLANPSTFERGKLDFSERARNRRSYDLHRDRLQLRREDSVFNAQTPGGGCAPGKVLDAPFFWRVG